MDLPLAILNLVALCAIGLLAFSRHVALRAARARLAASEAKVEALRAAAAAAQERARLMDSVMAAMADGVSVFDDKLRLVGWNPRFPEVTGVPRAALRIGAPLVELLRLQAQAGEFGFVDPDAEVARRMAEFQVGPMIARTRRERPDGSTIEVRRAALPGGGFVTLYTPLLSVPEIAQTPELSAAFVAEWKARLPRLVAAAADADASAVRSAAHALRGIAANAGWRALSMTLAAIESLAEAGDMREIRGLTALLPSEPDA